MRGVTGIAYVRYQAPDLDVMEKFLVDFGLTRSERTASALYMRGTGDGHHVHITEFNSEARGLGVGLLAALAARDGVALLAQTGERGAGGVGKPIGGGDQFGQCGAALALQQGDDGRGLAAGCRRRGALAGRQSCRRR